MTTQPGELDETLVEEGTAQEEQAEQQAPAYMTRDEVLQLVQQARQEATQEAYRLAQRRMEGELNSAKDRRFNDLEKRIADYERRQAEVERQRQFEATIASLDEDQQRAMRLLWQQGQTTPATQPPPEEPAVQQPKTEDEAQTVANLERYVQGFGITAKWGDNHPVWKDLTDPDPSRFMAQLNKNIVAEVKRQATEQPSQNGQARRPSPPPAMAPRAAAGTARTRDQALDQIITGKVSGEEAKRLAREHGIPL